MNSDLAMTNVSFSFLNNSSTFLNTVLNNISSCVLLLDRKMELRAFNNSLKTIFSSKKNEDLLYMRCGEAIGCAYHVEEQVDCGKTTKCNNCELRVSALTSYMNNTIIYKDQITKPFFTHDNRKHDKNLQFSTRVFSFQDEKYILLIIDDVTPLVESRDSSC